MTEHFPDALKNIPLWCLHIKKAPYGPNKRKIQLDHAEQFMELKVAREALKSGNFDGLELRIPNGWGCIDLDHCVAEDGSLSPLAQTIMQMFPGAYWEWSLSGTGLHAWIWVGDLSWWSEAQYKCRTSEIEFYLGDATNRVMTVTEKPYPGTGFCPDEDYSQQACEMAKGFLKRPQMDKPLNGAIPIAVEEPSVQDAFEEMSEDSVVLNLMLNSSKGEKIAKLIDGDWEDDYPSQSEADQALANYLAFFTKRNAAQMHRIFRGTGLMRPKWEEHRGAKTYGQMTIERAIQSCRSVYDPTYHVAEESQQLGQIVLWIKDNNVISNSRYTPDDMGNGFLLADWVKPFARYCPEAKAWYYYDEGIWVKDVGGVRIAEAAKQLSTALLSYVVTLESEREKAAYLKVARRWFVAGSRRTYIEEAKSVHPIPMSRFDAKPMLLNCQNGTLDLETGEFHTWNPADLLTRKAGASYDPAARCERWELFVKEVMQGDSQTAEFLQRWVGYCLTGGTSEEKAVILYGRTTRNGKSTFCETLATMMGDYATAANPETFGDRRQRDGSAPSEDIARLRGCRFVTVAEPSQQLQLDAARLKQITGGDTITARFLGENSFSYKPEFKLTFNSNVLPSINDMTIFHSGRLMVVPFDKHFKAEEQDQTLKRTLRQPENLSGILNWALGGLFEKRAVGLNPSEAMREILTEYQIENDKISRFMEDCLPVSQNKAKRLKASDVYGEYQSWCNAHGHRVESQTRYLSALRDRGVEVDRKRPTSGETTTTVIVGRDLFFTDFEGTES